MSVTVTFCFLQAITSKVEVVDTAGENITVEYTAFCLDGQPQPNTQVCEGLSLGDTVSFEVTVTANTCPESRMSRFVCFLCVWNFFVFACFSVWFIFSSPCLIPHSKPQSSKVGRGSHNFTIKNTQPWYCTLPPHTLPSGHNLRIWIRKKWYSASS